MWFKLNLSGIEMNLRIKDYVPPRRYIDDDNWCRVDFSFVSEPWLNYYKDDYQVLSSFEVDILRQYIDDLLKGKLSEPKTIEFIEPDFNFILYPKNALKDEDICIEMKIYFWDDGCWTENFLSVTLYREEIEHFNNYLLWVTGKVDKNEFNW